MSFEVIEINGAIDHYGWQSSDIRYKLNKSKGSKVVCRINSPGGSVDQAIAISKLFEEHGNVTVEFIGFCASCVTFMAFGAKEIIASDDTFWLCHRSMAAVEVYKMMNVEDIDNLIAQLESNKQTQQAIDLVIAKKYLNRCEAKGKTLNDIFDLMDQDKWITAQEALEWGFIDSIRTNTKKVTNEMRELMIENCAVFKLPQLPKAQVEEEHSTFVEKVIAGIRDMLPTNRDNTTTTSNTTPNLEPIMNKTFIPVNTILKVEGLTEHDGKIELTAEQMTVISQALEVANKRKTEIDNAVATLDAISDNVKAITGLDNKINAVKMVINQVPTGVPATPTLTGGEGKKADFKDCTDPVNAYLDGDDE